MAQKRQRVIIVGGGVAGLTAAHELIERDFDVDVYERRDAFGGKASSVRVQASYEDERRPGEHGFRFFPGWYRHLPDTMRQIPRGGARERERDEAVSDHLVPTERNLLAQYNRDRVPIILHAPTSPSQAQTAIAFVRQIAAIGLPMSDVLAFFGLLAEFLRTPLEERERKYDAVSWWDFVKAEERSEAFRTISVATTRTLLAAKAEKASAFTVATMAVRTLFDSPNRPDRVLDGPTNEVWIDPWVSYLEGRGVKFHRSYELDSVIFEGKRPRISKLSFVRSDEGIAFRQLRRAQASETTEAALRALRDFAKTDEATAFQTLKEAGAFEWADPIRKTLRDRPERDAQQARILGAAPAERLDARAALVEAVVGFTVQQLEREPYAASEEAVRALRDYARRFALDDVLCVEASAAGTLAELRALATEKLRTVKVSPVTAGAEDDFYVFALPVEQMAYYVNRSTTMKSYDPSLKSLVALSAQVDWMAGIQFYLKSPLKIERGHIVCADSEWALTAIEQTQFWRNVPLPKGVQSVLSVDISAWDQAGRFNRKEAFLCTPEEIAEEAWSQLKESLNRSGEQDVLRDTALVTGRVAGSYHLDDNIVDRYDRKKQAAYVEAQGRVLGRLGALEVPQIEADPAYSTPFLSGDRLAMNVEPLLVNRPNSIALRPGVRTKIENMFLAADYVKTSTNLVSMEGANEAARLAVNAILDVIGSLHARCPIWTFEDREIFARLASLFTFADRIPGTRTSIEAAASTASSFAALARRATNNVKQLWNKS